MVKARARGDVEVLGIIEVFREHEVADVEQRRQLRDGDRHDVASRALEELYVRGKEARWEGMPTRGKDQARSRGGGGGEDVGSARRLWPPVRPGRSKG